MNGDLPEGQFKITSRTAAADLNLSKSTITRLINEFEGRGIIDVVKKSSVGRGYSIYKYVTERNSKVMPEDDSLIVPFSKTVDGTLEVSEFNDFKDFEVPNVETVGEPKNGPSKIENLNKDLNKNNIYTRVIEHLNDKANKRFKSNTAKTKACIGARLNEGFVEEDFYRVIDIKCSQWMDSDMEKFLRPETLFSNKFESYLNEKFVDIDENLENVKPYNIDFNF
jgi:uncharacterized phage protein (TIGR02220 family)